MLKNFRGFKINRFKILVFISFGFVLYYLITKDIFNIPIIHSFKALVAAQLLLFLCFIIESLLWRSVLLPDYNISRQSAIISVGLSIFTKYIPGKVMVILGRAEYIKNKYDYPLPILINRSFHAQILAIFTAIAIGSISLLTIENNTKYLIAALVVVMGLSLLLFTTWFHKILERAITLIIKKTIPIPNLKHNQVINSLPLFLFYWALLSLSFYFFLSAFSINSVHILSGFVFPLSVVFGILVLISPGGIGFREGLLAGLLHLSEMDLALATSIAIISRLWFLMGESFLFIVAIILSRTKS